MTGRCDANCFWSLVLYCGRRPWPVKAHLQSVSEEQSSIQGPAYP